LSTPVVSLGYSPSKTDSTIKHLLNYIINLSVADPKIIKKRQLCSSK
jgi:hypothetical protein